MATGTANISVSIVSHQQIDLVIELLNDLKKCAHDNINVILTLNLSDELGLNINDYSFPIKIIKNINPKGFGANHNQAFECCNTPYFCVLNPDIRLQNNPFPLLIDELNKYSSALIAPKVVNPQGVVEDSVRKFPTPLSILKKIVQKNLSADYPTNHVIVNPDWVGGMFMLFRSEAFKQIGGFDQRYFLYYEDVDICRTLHQSENVIIYTPNTSVIHAARRTSHKKVRYLILHLTSMLRFFIKWQFK